MSISLSDKIALQLHGEPSFQIVDHETGAIIEDWTQANVIVLDARVALIAAVSAPTANSLVSKIKLGSDLGEIATNGSTSLVFTPGSPGYITRPSGSWLTDKFVIGDQITIEGTTSNNGNFTITALSATVLTVTTGQTITTETTTTAQICRGIGTAPSAPVNTYNENTQANTSFAGVILFNAPYTLNAGALNSLQAVFNVTIIGADVIAAQSGSPTSVNMSSAALYTGNGKVFAYARFAQKSISALVDINISWTISWQ